jgi:toxin ParE1/3/4
VIVRYTRRAQNDLTKIFGYLDARSPRGAFSVKLAIKRTIETMADNPEIGFMTSNGAVRGVPVRRYPYLVFWFVEAGEVSLVHVRHGARKPWRLRRSR